MRMKKLLTFLTLLTLSIGVTWAEEKTITLNATTFGSPTSYQKKSATVGSYSFTVDQMMTSTAAASKGAIQMNSSKGSGTLYNTTAIPGLKSITVNVASGNKTYTITTGNSQNPTTNEQTGTTGGTYNAQSGDTYFQLKVSGASYFSSIVITYEEGGSQQTSHNITYAEVTGGSFSGPASAAEGAEVTIQATPADGYNFGTWNVTDASGATITVTDNKFTMGTRDVTVSGTFVEKPKYAISVTNGIADPEEAYEGQTVTLLADLPDGKVVDMATTTITPSSVTLSGSGDTYTFTMPGEVVTIVFAFMDAPVQSNRFERITSTDDLEAGVRYLLVCEGKSAVMGSINSSNYGNSITGSSNFTLNNGVIVLNDNTNVEPLTLNGAPTEWTFKFGNDSYLNWSSGNSLNSTNSVTPHSQWVIQFDNDGNAKISNLYSINNQSSSVEVRYIKYNSSSPRFACYTTGQTSIQLYKEVAEVPQVSDVYIIGQVNGHDSDPWVSTEGVQMTYNSTNDNYSADIYCTGVNNGTHEGYSLFMFAKSLPYTEDNSNFYGSGADGSYWGIGGTNESAFGDEIPLYEGSKNSYRLPAGLYTVTVDLDYTGHQYTTKSVKVTKRDVTMVITPNSETFETTKNVTMSSNLTDIGGKIYYTTNGNDPRDPNSGRIEYTGQLTIDATTTFKAVAFVGNLYSDVVEKTYTKQPAAPVITPNGGTIYAATQVTITAEEGATIYYTTDGSTPTPENGTQYTAPFTVSATTTVKARAYVGDVYSSVTTAEFTYSDVQPSTGDFVLVTSANQLVAGNEYIIMTKDADDYTHAMGNIVSSKGSWTQEFDINGNVGAEGSTVSVYTETTESTGLVNILELESTDGQLALKQQSAGTYLNITGNSTDIKGSDSKTYLTIAIDENNIATIKGYSTRQILFYTGNDVYGNYASSNVGKSGYSNVYLYTRESNSVQPPVFTPAGGVYDVPVDVTISCATTGASIYYTTDGTEPSATNGTLYDGEEFLVSETTTYKAVAVKNGNTSSVVTAEYTIAPHTAIETVTLDYSEPFTAGIGKFTVQNVSGFAPVWTLDGEFGIKGTSYSANTNPTNNAAESRFLSPIIDMTDATQPELTFSHQINSYFTDVTNQCQLFIRETTDGTDGAWVLLPITFSDPAANGGWTNDVANIDLSEWAGKKVQISFLYTNPTEGSGAGTWEIQHFVVADNSEYKMVNNIAEFLALPENTKAKFRNPVTVLYDYAQYSHNSYHEYIWVKDESGYMQFYLVPTLNSGTSLDNKAAYYENGDIIPGGFVVTKNYYTNGKYIQAFSDDALNAGFQAATQKGLADPEYMDFNVLKSLNASSETDVANWSNHYITLEKIKLTSSSKNFNFQDENGTTNSCVGYNKYNGDGSLLKDGETSADVDMSTLDLTKFYNVKGIIQLWQGGWEFMPIEFTEWKTEEVTLRKLCADGVEQNTYTISNPLQVVYVDTDRKSVWVKDGTGQSIWSTSPEAPNAENFAIEYASNTRSQQAYYDQSNWCQLVFDDEIPTALVNLPIINGGMITGKFTNKMNPTLENVELGENFVQTESSSYTTNYYVAANFNGPQLGYFFMNPKPQEYADIVWAIYDAETKTMTMPSNTSQNPERFTGSFKVDMSMNLDPTLVLQDGTQTGKGYDHFHAIIRLASTATSNAPMLKDRMPANTEYVVYPLDITQDVPTGITDVNGKAVKSVKYVNVAGMVSDKPFSGVNIVVTEYTDGSRSTTKMLRK